MELAKDEGYRIIYIDEFCTTQSTIPKSDWWIKNSPIKVDLAPITKKTIASVAAISYQKGAELICSFEKSINIEKFITFLRKL